MIHFSNDVKHGYSSTTKYYLFSALLGPLGHEQMQGGGEAGTVPSVLRYLLLP